MKTFFQGERYNEQRMNILDAFDDNNGKLTWTELRRLSIAPAVLSEHLSRLERSGKVVRDDAEEKGNIVTSFTLRRR